MTASDERIAAGVAVSERGVSTIEDTLSSLAAAGFENPRLFVDGSANVPEGYAISRRVPKVGGWPNFLLAVNELVLRHPKAIGYLLVQDDVIFSRRAAEYFQTLSIPPDVGVVSFFAPACYNYGFGWNRVQTGWGFCGAQALYFPSHQARSFIASDFVANYRFSPPKSHHFKQDGLYHIDAVVGEWCRQARRSILVHSPSLSQHIGVSSAMWSGGNSNVANRYADDFPGENCDAKHAYTEYHAAIEACVNNDLLRRSQMPPGLWATVLQHIKSGTKTCEFGVGASTILFGRMKCSHTCVDANSDHVNKLDRFISKQDVKFIGLDKLQMLAKDKLRGALKVVFVGEQLPDLPIKDMACLIAPILTPDGMCVVSKTNSEERRALIHVLAEELGWDVFQSSGGEGGYAIIQAEESLQRPPLWR